MGDKYVNTPYGNLSARLRSAALSALCLNDEGIQTGPFGSQLHQRDYVAVGTPIITVEHLGENRIIHSDLPRVTDEDRNRLARYTLREGDIVFSRVGSVDRRAHVSKAEDGWLFSGRCLRVRPKSEVIDSRFLSYFFGLSSFKDYIRKIAVGATMPSLNTHLLSDVLIYYPPLPEQKAIASILGALDDKIELNRKTNETLEAMARAIFKSWFVDFAPIPGLGAHKEWQDSPLGKIPKGWRVGTLGELVDFINERVEATPKKDREKYIALDDMPHRSVDLAQFRSGSEVNSSIIRFKEGDILFGAMRPYFHKVGLAQFEGITRATTFVLRPKEPHMCLFALMNFFSDSVIEYATNASVGSTIPYIKWDALAGYQILMPTKDLIEKYNNVTMPMIHQIKVNSKQSRILASIRDALLPKLLSGEIRVKDAEKMIEATA